MVSSTEGRLIWFHHFHKAGGTSIVQLAGRNGERFFEPHHNGNPLDAGGRPIPLWQWQGEELSDFVARSLGSGVTFVACEWGLAELAVLAKDPRVRLVTCLREPAARFLSNYYFDLHLGFTRVRTPREFLGSRGRAFTRADYYCRTLAKLPLDRESDEADLALALDNLSRFDYVVDLAQGFGGLCAALGWRETEVHANRHRSGWREVLSAVRHGRPDLAWLRLLQPVRPVDPEFRRWFDAIAGHDLRIYQEARVRARALLAAQSEAR